MASTSGSFSWEPWWHLRLSVVPVMSRTGSRNLLSAQSHDLRHPRSVCLDGFVFLYFFHELALVPTFIMIGVWGRGQNRNYATYKITLYLSFGALLALIGLIGVYVQTGAESFSIPDLMKAVEEKPITESAQQWIFPLLMFGLESLVALAIPHMGTARLRCRTHGHRHAARRGA